MRKFALFVAVAAASSSLASAEDCYALDKWWQGSCFKCSKVNDSGDGNLTCIEGDASNTPCYSSMDECTSVTGAESAGNDDSSNSNSESVTTPKPTRHSQAANPDCWASTQWNNDHCKLCVGPMKDTTDTWTCPKYNSGLCYSSEAACIQGSHDRNSGGDGQPDGDGGPPAVCTEECPTTTAGFTRPAFKGPNCYDSKYGGQYGTSWAPSGKTTFERLVKSPTELHTLMQTVADPLPQLSTWGLKGCRAATAVYENIVCAMELLQDKGTPFEGVANGAGYTVDDLFGSGDTFHDKLELAAFFGIKMKETGRWVAWDEQNNDPAAYRRDDDTQYPPTDGVSYHGRGPVQITWNFNYGAFSEYFHGDKFILLNNPEFVDPEGPMGFVAAVWFWMTPRDFTSGAPIAGTMRCHDAILHWTSGKLNNLYQAGVDYDSAAGFGLCVNVVNGGLECASNNGGARARASYFLTVADKLGITIPYVEDWDKCKTNPLCAGLHRGCSAQLRSSCPSVEGLCSGKDWVKGWDAGTCKRA